MPSNHLVLCCPLLLLPSVFPSIREWLFPVSQFFPSGDQSIEITASASVLPVNIQDWFFYGWLVWFPCSPRVSQESSQTPQFKSSWALSSLYGPTLTSVHDYWKNHSFDYTDFVGKVMSLLFSMLFRLVIAFLPRSKHLLISWLQSSSAVILEPKKIKSHCFPICLPWNDGTGCHDLNFLNVQF